MAVILSNPDQSKHLETAKMKLAGLEIDLVNLRSESYADSRIPTMEIGTPREDAMRCAAWRSQLPSTLKRHQYRALLYRC